MQKKCLKFKEYFKAPLCSLEKRSTIRGSQHGLEVGDQVCCEFEESKDYIYKKVAEINEVTFKDLNYRAAWCEEYKHPDFILCSVKNRGGNINDYERNYLKIS